jgi:hypothetical protein
VRAGWGLARPCDAFLFVALIFCSRWWYAGEHKNNDRLPIVDSVQLIAKTYAGKLRVFWWEGSSMLQTDVAVLLSAFDECKHLERMLITYSNCKWSSADSARETAVRFCQRHPLLTQVVVIATLHERMLDHDVWLDAAAEHCPGMQRFGRTDVNDWYCRESERKSLEKAVQRLPRLTSTPIIMCYSETDEKTLDVCLSLCPHRDLLEVWLQSGSSEACITTVVDAVPTMHDLRILTLRGGSAMKLNGLQFRRLLLDKPRLQHVLLQVDEPSTIEDADFKAVANKCPSLESLQIEWYQETDRGEREGKMSISVDTINLFFTVDAFRGLHLSGPVDMTFIGAGTGAFDVWRTDPRKRIMLARTVMNQHGEPRMKVVASAPRGARWLNTIGHSFDESKMWWHCSGGAGP